MPKSTLVFNVMGWVEGEIEAPNADAVDDMIDANPNCWKITKDGLTYDLKEIEFTAKARCEPAEQQSSLYARILLLILIATPRDSVDILVMR